MGRFISASRTVNANDVAQPLNVPVLADPRRMAGSDLKGEAKMILEALAGASDDTMRARSIAKKAVAMDIADELIRQAAGDQLIGRLRGII